MRKFFIIVTILIALFTVWCWYSEQPRETRALNMTSMMLALHLAIQHKKNTGYEHG